MLKRLAGNVPYWIFRRLEEMEELFGWFLKKDTRYVLFLQPDGREILCLWLLARRFQGFSMIPYGTGDFLDSHQWNFKSRKWVCKDQTDDRAGKEKQSPGVCSRIPILLQRELSALYS
ncbi:MAG: hypothetical protein ACLTK4_05745 [Roseburia intestinalis]